MRQRRNAAISVAALLLAGAGCPRPEGPAQSPKASAASDAGPARATAATTAPVAAPPTAPAPTGAAPPTAPSPSAAPPATAPELPKTIKLRIASAPKSTVRWGKKTLGVTPLVFERPRDSGPVDLVFVARGYFPVHTRAFTWKSDSVHVQMTKLADRQKLYGAKKEQPAAPSCDPAGPCPSPPPSTPPAPGSPTAAPPGSAPPAAAIPPPAPAPGATK